MSRRAKMLAAGGCIVVAGVSAAGYYASFPQRAPEFVKTTLHSVGIDVSGDEEEPPPPCPLTGEAAPDGVVPDRPALAIKVENHPDARPQAALNDADIVVEQPVEGGYTRFIAIYQCGGAGRVGPVRSGRTTDPDYLRQLGPAVFGYAGGVEAVKREVPAVGLVDVNYILAAEAYTRDEERSAPHDLFTTTRALWRSAGSTGGAPAPLFSYAEIWEGRARRVAGVHLPYSTVSDVVWTWDGAAGSWLRSHGEVPHVLEGGDQVSAATVVIQLVDVTDGDIVDPAGNPSPEVELTGEGRAYVLRDGVVISGRWTRPTLDDATRFYTGDGTEIALAPGRAWVELLPSRIEVELLRRSGAAA